MITLMNMDEWDMNLSEEKKEDKDNKEKACSCGRAVCCGKHKGCCHKKKSSSVKERES